MKNHWIAAATALWLLVTVVLSACLSSGNAANAPQSSRLGDAVPAADDTIGSQAHYERVMSSAFCGTCHPAIYAEHEQNTHGRAYTDKEVRLATGNFRTADCIRCHTPRPIFETGIGNNPQRRWSGLVEGNTCMTCHWREQVDYSRFTGGPDCKNAFDPRVGEVEACGSCHKNHGTPFQWENSPNGKLADRTCIDCHMRRVERPVAVGGPVRRVRSHVFPGARDVAHVARAYDYEAAVVGNEVVVTIANSGAGHNFPTELRQRSLESLIVVRDRDGAEIARSRLVFRDPYRRPYGMVLPTNKQIPSGEQREHRVPLAVADGTVECELHYKYYFPIEDNHPDLARRLEQRQLVFQGIAPNPAPVVSDPYVDVATPEGIDPQQASPSDLGELAAAPIGTVEFVIPTGDSPAVIDELVALFNFQMPEANRKAMDRLVAIGAPAVPALVAALGSWDNKTFHKAQGTLLRIGAPAVPALREALASENLYVRLHARELLGELATEPQRAELAALAMPGLTMANALDRAGTAELLAHLDASDAAPAIRRLLEELDADVVRAAALALADLDDRDSVAAIRAAMQRTTYVELRIDLAEALARLGDTAGIPHLLTALDHDDDLLRELAFDAFVRVTGEHRGFEVMGPRDQRLTSLSRLQDWWARNGERFRPQRFPRPSAAIDREAFHLVEKLGGGAGLVPAADDDQATIDRLLTHGEDALPALIRGLAFPPGFAAKRASILATMQRLGDRRAAPWVLPLLRDPVYGVAHWAAATLEQVGDAECLPGLRRFEGRVQQASHAGELPASIPSPDPLLAHAARARFALGDPSARHTLVALLSSADVTARRAAIESLMGRSGDDRGYDPDAPAAERLQAIARWVE